jgi:hypothetical protein
MAELTTDTTMALVKAYLSLADMHRKAADECSPHSYLRGLHRQQAEMADIHAMAWTRRAESEQAAQGLEVRHA